MAAGTVTVSEIAIRQIHEIKFSWTSGTSGEAGTASGTTRLKYTGNIFKVVTIPGSGGDAPDDNYDITITNSAGVDVANGQLANRATAATQLVVDNSSTPMMAVASSKLTINVTNAGSANTGVCYVYVARGAIYEDSVAVQNALYGATGIESFPAAAAPANNVSLAEVTRSIWGGLMGTATDENGIATFPNAAVPANNVSLAEVLRSVWAGLMGTATGENGITTWPAAAAPGNAVSLAEGLRYIVESQLGALTNSGGTTTLTAILGDVANSSIATRLTNLANQTTRTTAAKAQASVASADLFTISGGPVRVLSIVGQITTVIETKANNTKLTHTATGGSAVDLCATADITAAAERKLLTITGIKANALQISTDAGVVTLANNVGMPLVLTAGKISLNAADTSTGAISWYIEYEPLVPGAAIVAA